MDARQASVDEALVLADPSKWALYTYRPGPWTLIYDQRCLKGITWSAYDQALPGMLALAQKPTFVYLCVCGPGGRAPTINGEAGPRAASEGSFHAYFRGGENHVLAPVIMLCDTAVEPVGDYDRQRTRVISYTAKDIHQLWGQ